jgi:thiol-disulfide isomerase/thioredoxin
MADRERSKRARKDAARRARAEAERAAERRQRYARFAYAGAAVVAVVLVVVVMVTVGKGSGKPSPPGSVTVSGPARDRTIPKGEQIPSFSAPALSGGGRVDWSAFAGKKVVLPIWASWCPHCQAELPVLSRVVGGYPGVSLVSITSAVGQEPGPSPQRYMKDHGLAFPVAVDDADATLSRAFGLQFFPTVYFVNSDGTVASVRTGEVSEADLRTLIGALT